MARITINGISDDPFAVEEAPGLEGSPEPLEYASDYILIQTADSLDGNQITELVDVGVTVLEYLPPVTYIGYYAGTDFGPIRALPYVTSVASYSLGYKVAPTLSPDSTTLHSSLPSMLELAAESVSALQVAREKVDVVFHDNVEPNAVRQKLATAAHVEPDSLQMGRNKARVSIERQYLSDVAAIDEVRHIEKVLPAQFHNNVARTILGVEASNNGTALEGKGQIVVVADSGFDVGDVANEHVHPAFKDRVLKLYPLGRPGTANDPMGHGTHVCGSALGNGISTTYGPVRGVAPQALLIVQSLLGLDDPLAGLPTDLRDLFNQPYQNDAARIHTNSWGKDPAEGQYNEDAKEVDDFVWNHRDCVICFSAGNAASDNLGTGHVKEQTIPPPATAKNCITVGASETTRAGVSLTYNQFRSADFPVDPIAKRNMANNPESVAAFSGRGLTEDERFKPDLVAPGTFILSTISRAMVTTESEVRFDSGTSMATPLVAGCVALLREFLASKHHISNPSAALVKALLINGARDIAEEYSPHPSVGVPNVAEGFGRVDMAGLFGPGVTFHDEATVLANKGQQESKSFIVSPGSSQLKVTLVWTDFPGRGLCNDLDLIVRGADGQELHGNKAPGSAEFDRKNNVEQVTWSNVPVGEVQIIVKAHQIWKPQTYALVIRTT